MLFLQALIASAAFGQAPSGYTLHEIQGWRVYVQNRAVSKDATKTRQAIDLLNSKLQEIDQMDMSPSAKAFVKTVPFFMDWNKSPRAQYHPSRNWLVNNGYIPEKERSVDIGNVTTFIDRTATNQPYVVLHELSHAYHHQILGYDHQDIERAYSNAMASGRYDRVDYFTGTGKTKRKAYAATNSREYFAELTEAYFGKNDFYPFNRSELQSHDTQGFAAVRSTWQGDINRKIEPVVKLPPTQTQPVDEGVPVAADLFNASTFYRLTNRWQGEGRSLDIINDGVNNNKPILADSGNYSGQKWRVFWQQENSYVLSTSWKGTGEVLGSRDGSIRLYKEGADHNVQWSILDAGNGFYRICNQSLQNRCLDVINDGANNRITLTEKADYTGQFWRIEEVR